MKQLSLLGVVVLVGCSGSSDDPVHLLGLASQSTLRVEAVSYDFLYRETGAEGDTVRFDGSVFLGRMKDSLNYRMRLSGMSDGEPITIVADGQTGSTLDVRERPIRHSSIYSAGGTLRAAALPAVMEAFLKPAPFGD